MFLNGLGQLLQDRLLEARFQEMYSPVEVLPCQPAKQSVALHKSDSPTLMMIIAYSPSETDSREQRRCHKQLN